MVLGSQLWKSVLLFDKPKGWTSFDAVERVSRLLGVRKAGHTGTLDPNATGLLVIALGESRKAMPVLMGLDKEYVGVMRLHFDVEKGKLEKALKRFTGEIVQTPPVKSRVARKPRKRTVHELEILRMRGRDVEFRVLCEAGTYIRKLAHDLGEGLGAGAHLTGLRRTKVGPFSIGNATDMPGLGENRKAEKKKSMVSLENALDLIGLPRVTIEDEHEAGIRNGSPVRKSFVREAGKSVEGAYCGIYNRKGEIIAIGRFVSDGINTAKTERVFIREGE